MLCKEFFDILSLVQFNTRILLQIVISLNIQEHRWIGNSSHYTMYYSWSFINCILLFSISLNISSVKSSGSIVPVYHACESK